jgi:hypothetical protein
VLAISGNRDSWDDSVLRLRAARALRTQSWRAALNELAGGDVRALTRELTRRRYRRADIDAALADMGRIAAPSGWDNLRRDVLALLVDRRAAGLKELRAELAGEAPPEATPAPFRLVDGQPRPYRPRDLDWSIVSAVLQAEGAR